MSETSTHRNGDQMPVTFKKGDIFQSEAQAICNACNCVGVMGGGLALLFARRFPAMNEEYKLYCKEKKLKRFVGGWLKSKPRKTAWSKC